MHTKKTYRRTDGRTDTEADGLDNMQQEPLIFKNLNFWK